MSKGTSNVLIQKLLSAEEEAEKIVARARESEISNCLTLIFPFIS